MENLNEIKEALKDMFRATIKNDKNTVENEERWITLKPNGEDAKGVHIKVQEGETNKEATERKVAEWKEQKRESKEKPDTEKKKVNDFDKKYSEIKKIIKDKNWEPLEEESALEELEDYKREFNKNLEPRQEEALLEKLEDYKTKILDKYPKFNNPSEYKKSDGNENKHGFKKDKDSGYYMKDLSDGTSVYVEKKEGGQGEKEPFYLEATHFDKDGKEIAKKQYHYDSMDGMFSKIDRDFSSKEKPNTEKKGEGEGGKGYSLSKEYKNHVQFEGDKESGGYPRKIHKDLESAKKSFETKKEGQNKAEDTNLKRSGKRGIPLRDNPVIVKNPLGDGFIIATHGLAQKHDLTEVYPVNREDKIKNGLSEIIQNCKPETEQDLKVLKGLKNILENEDK